MKVELFTLCDAATVSGGKLNLLGSFDTIFAGSFPYQHPFCALAAKIRFDLGEEGNYRLEILFADPDMHPVLPPLKNTIQVGMDRGTSVGRVNLWNLHGFRLQNPGEYYFELRINDEPHSRIPLYAVLRGPAAGPEAQ